MATQISLVGPTKETNIKQHELPWWIKTLLVVAIVLPFLSVFVAAWQLWNSWVSLPYIVLMLISYLLVASGVTVGLHRYFTHQSFKATKGVKIALCALASMAIEGPILEWVANHKAHHALSDTPEDLHSPVARKLNSMEPESFRGIILGLWHAHIGWLFTGEIASPLIYASHLTRDKMVLKFSRMYPWWILITLAAPVIIGGIIGLFDGNGFLWGAGMGLLWGGFVRVFLVHHFTWAINSVCHVWGDQPYRSTGVDNSGNVAILAIPTLGESYHRTHHAFPTSARHGTAWWNDPSYTIILILSKLGLVSEVKLFSKEQMEKRRMVQ